LKIQNAKLKKRRCATDGFYFEFCILNFAFPSWLSFRTRPPEEYDLSRAWEGGRCKGAFEPNDRRGAMRRLTVFAIASLLAVSTAARADAPLPAALDVLGSVSSAARPVANALVIALNLKDLDAVQTFTATDGAFSLPKLRAGIYKVIAVKQGFAPAIATVLPTKAIQNVKLSLDREKSASRANSDEMWQIRASLPPDILRELDDVLSGPAKAGVAYDLPRFRGEMTSMSGVSDQTTSSSGIAQTSVGLLSRLNDNWQLGFRGNVHRIDDPTDGQRFGDAAAQSSVMSMELRSSPTDAYRVASTRSFWRYRDVDNQAADVTSHDVQWEHGTTRVGVHYFAQENLFTSNRASDLIEISGGTTVLQSRRGDIGVAMRVTQENVRSAATPTLRTADFTATGTFNAASALLLRYGMTSRMTVDGTELAPRTGADVKLGKNTALIVSGMYKVIDPIRRNSLPPSVVAWTDDGRVLPRYVYSLGIINGEENGTHVSAVATVSAIETPFRLIFPDVQQQFWNGFFVDSGDIRRDVRVSARRDLGNKLAIDVSTSAGTATPTRPTTHRTKAYVTSDVQSVFFPTGTSLMVSYMALQQPQESAGDYRSERVNVRMAQSLHLPLDLKLLLGVEVVRAENSPYLLDVIDPTSAGSTRRYMGGLALNF
jgi:hypothetical protein